MSFYNSVLKVTQCHFHCTVKTGGKDWHFPSPSISPALYWKVFSLHTTPGSRWYVKRALMCLVLIKENLLFFFSRNNNPMISHYLLNFSLTITTFSWTLLHHLFQKSYVYYLLVFMAEVKWAERVHYLRPLVWGTLASLRKYISQHFRECLTKSNRCMLNSWAILLLFKSPIKIEFNEGQQSLGKACFQVCRWCATKNNQEN